MVVKADAIRRNEVKIRKALASVASLPPSRSGEPDSIRFEVHGEWKQVHSPFNWGLSRMEAGQLLTGGPTTATCRSRRGTRL